MKAESRCLGTVVLEEGRRSMIVKIRISDPSHKQEAPLPRKRRLSVQPSYLKMFPESTQNASSTSWNVELITIELHSRYAARSSTHLRHNIGPVFPSDIWCTGP